MSIKYATWVGGPQDGEIVVLPPDTEFVAAVFVPDHTLSPSEFFSPEEFAETQKTKMRYPVKPGGPTGYRILYYEGEKVED